MLWRGYGFAVLAAMLSGSWTAVRAQAAQNAPMPLGMILQINGTVTVRRGADSQRAQIADFVFAGDQIATAANGRVTFSFCPASQSFSVQESSAVLIAASAVQQSSGAPAVRTAGAKCTLPQVALGKRDIEQIGVMGARGSPPIPLYVGGLISSARPLFTWTPVPTAKLYTLTVKSAAGQTLWTWDHDGEASEIRLPDAVPELQSGTYVWELTGRAGGKIVAQQAANFEVKPASVRPQDTASQLELAAAFENAGYYAEAAGIYRALRSQNGNDPRFTRQLIWLYWNAGLIAASNEELQKAKNPK